MSNFYRPPPPPTYHCHVRSEIAPLLPPSASRILDMGAGAGYTTAWLKKIYPNATTVATEGNEAVKGILATNADEVHIGDLNVSDSYLAEYDLVLCLDILEHLHDPAVVLKRIVDRLSSAATVIISLPNVANLSVALPLLLTGRFDYKDEGILDRTHLHFYTADSALDLARSAGLHPTAGVITVGSGRRGRALDFITLGLARKRIAQQFIFAAQKAPPRTASKIDWKIGVKL